MKLKEYSASISVADSKIKNKGGAVVMKKFNLRKVFTVSVVGVILASSLVVNALTKVGTSSATLSDTQTSNSGNLVALWDSTGQGTIRVRSTSGDMVYADARMVRVLLPDSTLQTVSTRGSSYTSWSPKFALPQSDRGYYVRVRGTTSATGDGEFEVYG